MLSKMDHKVTLPPISDIFTMKESGLPVPQHRHYEPHLPYPTMPVYSYQNPYMNVYGAASYGCGGSYSFGHNYSARPAGHHMPSLSCEASNGRSLALVSLRSLVGSDSRAAAAAAAAATATTSLPVTPPSQSMTPDPHAQSAAGEMPAHLQTLRARTRNNLPKETTYILLKWLNEHLSHPYPNSFEKTQLMMATGLNQQQLSNWFINARRRKIKMLRQKEKAAA